ncbi:protein ABHD18 isoform X2 [Anoplophora glabripennis]|uniref:protein ABHD18 isoform X2 n=1 Tax=Anoplophora glabripennis TaxID=217634 RepID=UPI0008743B78|nr:protein ABHD18 isoform X2 [Anoplophora glabripennis]
MPVSRLDVVYRKLLLTKFFTKGWGSPENLQRLFDFRQVISNRETCYKLVPKNYPITIINEVTRSDCRIIEGKFRSPFALHLPGLVSEEIHDSFFQMILPLKWKNDYKPICIHLAGTGDHYFWRRRNIMAKPLLKAGIGAIILENPYYGIRKPKDQIRSSLHYVSDIFVMGGCLVLECLVLLNWCEILGFGPLGVTGISMGGHGVMSESIDWDMLQAQYISNELYCDTLSKLCKIVDDPFACDLSRLPDVAFDTIPDLYNSSCTSYVTPHKVISMFNVATSNCPTIAYKQSSQTKTLFSSGEYSLMNLLKEPHPLLKPKKSRVDVKKRAKEALWFMRGMMDECTHLKNFSVPYDTSLIISVCARADGYVPRGGISTLEDIWPGATVKYVDCGHVGAYIWYRKVFRESIIEAFNRAKKKLPPPSPSKYEV